MTFIQLWAANVTRAGPYTYTVKYHSPQGLQDFVPVLENGCAYVSVLVLWHGWGRSVISTLNLTQISITIAGSSQKHIVCLVLLPVNAVLA